MDTSVTSCQTDVWSQYSDICTTDIRLIWGVCMDNLYTCYQIDVWNLYVHGCTQDFMRMFLVYMETAVHHLSDRSV
jgi:hypothetical protein